MCWPRASNLELEFSLEEAESLVAQGWRPAALLIPAGFTEAVDAGEHTSLSLIIDPTETHASRLAVQGVVEGAAMAASVETQLTSGLGQMNDMLAYSRRRKSSRPSKPRATETTGEAGAREQLRPQSMRPSKSGAPAPRITSRRVLPDTYQQNVPGYTVMFVFFIIGYVSASIRDEKRGGTLRRLLVTPASRAAILAGKLAMGFLIGIVQVALMFAVGRIFFGMGLGNNLPALLLLTMSLSAAATSIGLAASTVTRLGNVLTAPLIVGGLLGGCIFPLDWMPKFLQTISYLLPHRWAMAGYQDLMVRGQGLVRFCQRWVFCWPSPPCSSSWRCADSSSSEEPTMLRDIWAITRKDIKILLKQPGEWLLLFLTPFLFIAIMGQVFAGGDLPTTTIYVVDEDGSRTSEAIVDALADSEGLTIEALDNQTEADRRIGQGQRIAAIIIPAGFGDALADDAGAQIDVMLDPARVEQGSIVVGMLQNALAPWLMEAEIARGIDQRMDTLIDGDMWQLPEDSEITEEEIQDMFKAMMLGVVSSQAEEAAENPIIDVELQTASGVELVQKPSLMDAFVPGYTVMFGFFILTTIASTILTEKQEGTFRRMLITPARHRAILTGKLIPYFLVIVAQVLLLLVVSHLVFGVSLGNSPAGLIVMTLAEAAIAVALGIFLATVVRTQGQANGTVSLVVLVMAAISGAMYPLIHIPVVEYLTPHYWIVQGFLDLIGRGGDIAAILPEAGILLAMAAGFFGLAIWRFKFE